MAKKLPDFDRLHHCFEIDKESASGLTWKNPTAMAVKSGQVAGRKNSEGYWEVSLDSVRYKVHRIIYYMQTGEDPGDCDVDHIYGELDDNITVRKATKSQNLANSKKRENTSSRYKGVYRRSSTNKWQAEIQVNKKRIYIGTFLSEIEAAKAYNKVALEHFGEFCKINEIPDPTDSD